MSNLAQQKYNEISAFIKKNTSGSDYSRWYVGIATDPEERLFTDHGVKKGYIYRDAGNQTNARAVEKALVKNLKTQGGSGGGDSSTRYVYSYLTNSNTNP